ncbi:MAG: hypothetical protein HQK66_06735 [Desulfamplus sp.]|nr:hypothetical protein [Desulfamplus sp.]
MKIFNHHIRGVAAPLFFTAILLFSMVLIPPSHKAWASPFMTFPGARAKAMAGAFTAVADDTSSVWYNPAGFNTKRVQCTMEWSQAPTIDEETGSIETDQTSWFLGAIVNLDWFKLMELETGLFFYSPYTAKYWAHDDGSRQKAWGHIHETYRILGIPLAKPFMDGRIRLGMTLEWVMLDIGGSDIAYRDPWGWEDGYSPLDDNGAGLSGSMGAQALVIQDKDKSYDIKAGAVYRLNSSTDIGKNAMVNSYDKGIDAVFFDKPQSMDFGVALNKWFPTKENICISFQFGLTDWGKAGGADEDFSYTNIALGAEYEVVKKFGFIEKTAVRAGFYQSTASGDSTIWNWPDVTGITFGAGVGFGDVSEEGKDYFQIDLSQELRSLENSDGYDESASLTTFSVSWIF